MYSLWINSFQYFFTAVIFLFHIILCHNLFIFFPGDKDKHDLRPQVHHPQFHLKLVFYQIVSERRSGIKKSLWRWLKPINTDRPLSPNHLWLFGILHPELKKHVKTKTMSALHLSEGRSLKVTRQPGMKWRVHLTTKALSFPPRKPAWAVLRQRVVVGIFFWSVKKHLSVGERHQGEDEGFLQTQEIPVMQLWTDICVTWWTQCAAVWPTTKYANTLLPLNPIFLSFQGPAGFQEPPKKLAAIHYELLSFSFDVVMFENSLYLMQRMDSSSLR